MKQQLYDLEQRLLEYASSVIRLVEHLPSTRAGNHVAGHLLRSSMSPLPNHSGAQAADSREDSLEKLRTCLKELKESRRWLRFVKHVPLLPPSGEIERLLTETESLIRIFAANVWAARTTSTLRWRIGQAKPLKTRG